MYHTNKRNLTAEDASYLIPRTDDPAGKHKKVTHGNQAGPNDQRENAQKFLEDGLNADEHKHSQEDGQCRGNGDYKGHMVLNVLQKDEMRKSETRTEFKKYMQFIRGKEGSIREKYVFLREVSKGQNNTQDKDS